MDLCVHSSSELLARSLDHPFREREFTTVRTSYHVVVFSSPLLLVSTEKISPVVRFRSCCFERSTCSKLSISNLASWLWSLHPPAANTLFVPSNGVVVVVFCAFCCTRRASLSLGWLSESEWQCRPYTGSESGCSFHVQVREERLYLQDDLCCCGAKLCWLGEFPMSLPVRRWAIRTSSWLLGPARFLQLQVSMTQT